MTGTNTNNILPMLFQGIIYSNIKEKTLTQLENKNLLRTETINKNINKTRTNKKNGKCYICGKFGHYFKKVL